MSAPDASLQHQVRTLYLEHHGWLQAWLRRRLDDSQQAADLAHDTFLRLLAGRREHFGDEPRALLTHVAKGLVVDHWRRREVERAYLEALAAMPEAQAPSPETRLALLQTLVQIDTLLSGLAPRTRECFLLAQLDGLTLAQIAERLAMPVITVRRHVHKALVACMACV
ncbi:MULTISPECIES: sigma-70 family RNA polymerase sigma factor [unclassified Rubrivivax]|uniref:sigma-70 family RNA polymerase sigma factor n=1 Tax=unclassified Rubrivivax TaxID=2649762 RepID=UPI001E476902|nr:MULTISPECIES: sigma-70 family RNA polymerase sigma factor [unclassified Rubrivivax]MCC9597817.1 sigma-70 family RNA polymerase sigma factor [Rubrivivax sp. JA1055]MCC9645926.1 sigma-70 family RNA polymerase sigma factor [Rubrivivax sp. JA1029]